MKKLHPLAVILLLAARRCLLSVYRFPYSGHGIHNGIL